MNWRIEVGDCRDVLRSLPAQSVHTCVTSPPYFGLRDYGTGEWDGGDPACDHIERRPPRDERPRDGLTGGMATVGAQDGGALARQTCRCGARRVDRQIGLEPTPDEFVAALVEVFREVRRVLRDDGTVWLNLGDSYSGSGPSGASYQSETTKRRANGDGTDGAFRISKTLAARGLTYAEKKPVPAAGTKPKDLIGIPWMVAFALRADGWYLRSDIIWSKPNPMPESVTDRPTKAHEYVFLLSKGPRYFYDADAVREEGREDRPEAPSWEERAAAGATWGNARGGRPGTQRVVHGAGVSHELGTAPGRNKRSVWTVATQPYAGAHFATFPPKLIEPCILAGAPERACGECGAPWVRVVEVESRPNWQGEPSCSHGEPALSDRNPESVVGVPWGSVRAAASADVVPGVVLDPFAGAGTTGIVALQHGREFVGCELNPEYAAMARERIATAVRLGFRSPQNGPQPIPGQVSIFDLNGTA